MRVLLTRHPETLENVNCIVQENNDGCITQCGFAQLSNLINRLREEKISKIISSDSARCRKTVQAILRHKQVPFVYTELIREKSNGNLAGKNQKEVKWDDFGVDFETRKAPNGESLQEVRARGRKFFKELLGNKDDATILVVSHGTFLKILLGDLIGMSLYDSIFKLFIAHCSLTEIEIDKNKYKEGYQIKFLNENSYLGLLQN